jgi:hypothetical protein
MACTGVLIDVVAGVSNVGDVAVVCVCLRGLGVVVVTIVHPGDVVVVRGNLSGSGVVDCELPVVQIVEVEGAVGWNANADASWLLLRSLGPTLGVVLLRWPSSWCPARGSGHQAPVRVLSWHNRGALGIGGPHGRRRCAGSATALMARHGGGRLRLYVARAWVPKRGCRLGETSWGIASQHEGPSPRRWVLLDCGRLGNRRWMSSADLALGSLCGSRDTGGL